MLRTCALLLLLSAGCASDPTAAIKTTISVENEANGLADAFAEVVRNAAGWSDDMKAKVLADIAGAKETFALLTDVRAYLETVGAVQWREVVELVRKEAGI